MSNDTKPKQPEPEQADLKLDHTDSTDVSTKEGLFEPFVSMTFTEVKKASIPERIVSICNVLKAAIGLLPEALHILQILPQVLSWIFRLCARPLEILVEAKDSAGHVTLFMITDGRSYLARVIGLNMLAQMKLTRFNTKEDKKTLMTTRKARAFDCCCLSACCCVPIGFCNRIKQLELIDNGEKDDPIVATRPYRRCDFNEEVHELLAFGTDGMEQEIQFVQAKKECSLCGSTEDKENRVVPYKEGDDDDALANDKREGVIRMTIESDGFSLKDFFMEQAEFLVEDITENLEEEGGLEEMEEGGLADAIGAAGDVKEAVGEIQDTIKEMKEDVAAFKEQGYKKIETSNSKWEVEFPTEDSTTHAQKCAAMLFVIEKFAMRL